MRQFALAAAAVFLISISLAIGGDSASSLQPDRQMQALENMVDELKSPYQDASPTQRSTRGERINQAFVMLTGEAVNPLFGVTALGIYNYFRTDEAVRDRLPLHDQPVIWVPLLVVMLLMLFNSTICEALPFLKIPLNALGDIVNKAGAAAVLPLVVKMFADAVAQPAAEQFAAISGALFPAAYAAEASLTGTFMYSLGWLAGAIGGLAVYLAVWMSFNVIDVLILICPFPGIDALLKTFRISIVGALAGSYHFSPYLGAALAGVVVLASLFIAGWSFRLSVFGWLFSTDIIFRRTGDLSRSTVSAFASDGVCKRFGLPIRTLGRLEKTPEGELAFSYKPWLIMKRRRIVLGAPGNFSCGTGLLNLFLVEDSAPGSPWLRLPPRYCGQDERLVELLGLKRVVVCGTAGTLRVWLREQFGGGKAPAGAAN